MKKIILLALTALMMVGCMKDGKVDRSDFIIVELDSCEYIKWNASYGYQHKGNCRFCKELLDIENNAENIVGLAESQWVAIRAAHRLLGEYIAKEHKPAWSEKDNINCKRLLYFLNGGGLMQDHKIELFIWMESLKERYTWKPSDEQINALEDFVRSIGESGYTSPYSNNTKLLYLLLEQLKKLKG